MKIYHGTSVNFLPAILADGILPRTPENPGNWNSCPSKPGFVYLTTVFGLYFAACATGDRGEPLLVLEIETEALDPDFMAPDEDFIAQAIFQNRRLGRYTGEEAIDKITDLRELTNAIDPADYSDSWQLSIRALGQAAYIGPIPLSAITRYAIIDRKRAARIVFEGLEPTITIENFGIMGEKYVDLTAFVFGDRQNPPEGSTYYALRANKPDATPADVEALVWGGVDPDRVKHWKRQNINYMRSMKRARKVGIQVVTMAEALPAV